MIDVVDIEYVDVICLCDEGLLEWIDLVILFVVFDGMFVIEDFLLQGLSDCVVGLIVFLIIYVYDCSCYGDNLFKIIVDFFDVEKFFGKCGLKKVFKVLLEMVLMGDGVLVDQVYEVLVMLEGFDRVFVKLDMIKWDVVWWELGVQVLQFLVDGEVVMIIVYNGCIFNVVVFEGWLFEIVWDGQVYEYNLFFIFKGVLYKDVVLKFIFFVISMQWLVDQVKWISYGLVCKFFVLLVGFYQDGKIEMVLNMLINFDNMKNVLGLFYDFWVDYEVELLECFSVWFVVS